MTTPQNTIPKIHTSNFLVGVAPHFVKNPIQYAMRGTQYYGEIFKVPLTYPYQLCVITNPDIVKHILVTNPKNYSKSRAYKAIKKVLGNGLLTSEGDFWLKQRRLAQPAFHKKRLELLATLMTTRTQHLIDEIKTQKKIEHIDIHQLMMHLTMDIVSRSLFDFATDDARNFISKAIEAGNHYIDWMIKNPILALTPLPFKKVRKYKQHEQKVRDVLIQAINHRRENPSDSNDLLNMLINAKDEDTGEQMTDQQLFDEVLTIFVAGHETTAVALTWAIYNLSKNPDILQRLENEIDTVLKNETPTLAHLPQLKYANMVIQETMRLYPPAWIFGRKALQNDLAEGYLIEKNSEVQIFIYGIHRNPKYWDNPEAFDPERFTEQAIAQRHKYAYMPFGAGPRICIGNNFALMEMQFALVMLIQQLKFKVTNEVSTEALVTLRPQSPVYANITIK